nr:DUF5675 family protein [uncultured Pseudodesulfovibrio sp.]
MISRAELIRDVMDERVSMGKLFLYDEEGRVVLRHETLENPWLDNARNISCIPAGEYVCRRVISPKYGETFEITFVPGRTHILFHWGNYPDNTEGCVLLGSSRAVDVPAVWSSKAAHAEFMETTRDVEEFTLSIYEEAA